MIHDTNNLSRPTWPTKLVSTKNPIFLAQKQEEDELAKKRRKLAIYQELARLVSFKRRQITGDNFAKFIEIYLPHLTTAKTPDFHRELMELLQTGGERLLFVAPRGFGKSYLCSVFYPLWLALTKKKTDIFVVSATISLAKDHLRKIRMELENNEKLRQDYGEQKSEKWTEDHMIFKNGCVIRAKGRGFQIRGFRPDMIICDDLEDEEVLYSKEQRDKLEVWFLRTLLPALRPMQNLVYVGTKLHQFSLIAKLEVKKEFVHKVFKAITDEKSIWPELWPLEHLKKLKAELGEYAFQAEYQNNPISLEESPVKPHMLDGCSITGDTVVRCIAFDPAISEKESSDPRALVVFERTEEGFKELFSERGRWSISQQVEKVIHNFETFKPQRVIYEAVAFQKVFGDLLRTESRKRGLFMPVSTAELGVGDNKKPRDKFTRLMSVVHLFEQRLVQVINPELYEELVTFPFGEHDDLVDATVYALSWLKDYRMGHYMTKKSVDKLHIDTRKALPVVEVRPGVFMAQHEPPPLKIRTNFFNCDKPINARG